MNEDLRKAETEFKLALIHFQMKQAFDNLKKHEAKMENFKGKPATAGFVYMNPNDPLPSEDGEGSIPPLYLALHSHPDDPDWLFVVPVYERWELMEDDECFEFHRPALIDIPGTSLIAHFNEAKWMARAEVESWHLCDVYDDWKWKQVYSQWRKVVFG